MACYSNYIKNDRNNMFICQHKPFQNEKYTVYGIFATPKQDDS